MNRNTVISRLRNREAELRELGIISLSLFGSVARGEQTEDSDIDVAVKLDPARTPHGFRYAGYLCTLQERLKGLLQKEVDIVAEPARKLRLQERIDRDRVVAF